MEYSLRFKKMNIQEYNIQKTDKNESIKQFNYRGFST